MIWNAAMLNTRVVCLETKVSLVSIFDRGELVQLCMKFPRNTRSRCAEGTQDIPFRFVRQTISLQRDGFVFYFRF